MKLEYRLIAQLMLLGLLTTAYNACTPFSAVSEILALESSTRPPTESTTGDGTDASANPGEANLDDFHPAGYLLTFQDEFNGSLNLQNWNRTFPWEGRTIADNGEQQCYLEDNVYTEGGNLILLAKRQSTNCPGVSTTLPYTSGLVTSHASFSQTYGYFVVRAKLPKGRGLWPAFWLLPVTLHWPPEIDIFEVLGHELTSLYTTLHWADLNGAHQTDTLQTAVPDLSADYHVFAVDWQPGTTTWSFDGKIIHQHSSASVPNSPLYLLLNLAVGGDWPGHPDASTLFPAKMLVDFVRVYKKP